MITNLADQLARDEGKRNRMYPDQKGIMTIGIGHNLEAKGISDRAVQVIFEDDEEDARQGLYRALPWTVGVDEVRRGVLINMCFQMGVDGLLAFRQFLMFLQAGDLQRASEEMLDSLWAKQTPDRAHRLALQLTSGVWQ